MESIERLYHAIDKLEDQVDEGFKTLNEKIDTLFNRHSKMEASIQDMRTDVDRHTRLLDGNGKEGITTKLTTLEAVISGLEKSLEEEQAARRRLWGGVWGVASGVIVAVLGGAIMFFVK